MRWSEYLLRTSSTGRSIPAELRREGILSLQSNPARSQRHRAPGKGRTSPDDASLMEILDRVLDHGIIVDPSSRIRLLGLEPRTLREQMVIDWRDTYFLPLTRDN